VLVLGWFLLVKVILGWVDGFFRCVWVGFGWFRV